jgi:hypothetical protein
VRGRVDPGIVVLHAVARAHLAALELLDHRQVVGRARFLHHPQQLARREVAVDEHVARHLDLHARVGLLVFLDELLHPRQVEAVIPGGAEHAEHGVGPQAVDVGPVLLVVDPGVRLVELRLHDLLAQRLDVVAADRGGDDLRLDLLDLEQEGAEVARVLRHHQLLHHLAAVRLDQRARRFRGVVAPDIVVGEQQPVLAAHAHRVLDDGVVEIGAVAVPHELDAVAVAPGFGGRAGVRVEEHRAVLLRHLRDRIGHARVHGADQERGLVARDQALGHARAGGRGRLRVHVQGLDAPAEHAALLVELADGEHRAEALVHAARAVLAARVHGQADHQRLLLACLRPGMVHLPRPVERRAGREHLQQLPAIALHDSSSTV